MGEVKIEALRDASFEIEKGEICVIVGASGAGKTTLLNILGGMDTLSGGIVTLDEREISGLNARQLTTYRRLDVGFVFQFYNLIQNLTALENVEIAAQICPKPLDARQVLAEVGLADRMHNFPAQLSGGEQQRVAIARASREPKLLLCDEPTEPWTITRQIHFKAFYRTAPPHGHDRRHHHPQFRSDRDGRPGDPRQKRHRHSVTQNSSPRRGANRMVTKD
jgi:ABC-type lipoprotein export system ATPase subunit